MSKRIRQGNFEKLQAEMILPAAIENLEKKESGFYSYLKEYFKQYRKNDEKINRQLKKITIFLEEFYFNKKDNSSLNFDNELYSKLLGALEYEGAEEIIKKLKKL